jgi:hypothetical protein
MSGPASSLSTWGELFDVMEERLRRLVALAEGRVEDADVGPDPTAGFRAVTPPSSGERLRGLALLEATRGAHMTALARRRTLQRAQLYETSG